jgi:hypothetical protein
MGCCMTMQESQARSVMYSEENYYPVCEENSGRCR